MRSVAYLFAAACLLTMPLAANAQPCCSGGPPGYAIASLDEAGRVRLRMFVTCCKCEQREVTVYDTVTRLVDGKEVTEKVPVKKTVTVMVCCVEEKAVRHELDAFKVFDVDGTAVDAKSLPERLKKETPVLIAHTPNQQKLDPYYTQVFKKDTLVFVMPAAQPRLNSPPKVSQLETAEAYVAYRDPPGIGRGGSDAVNLPARAAPQQFLASIDKDGKVQLRTVTITYTEVERKKIIRPDGRNIEVIEKAIVPEITENILGSVDPKAIQFYGTDGKKRDFRQVSDALKKSTPIMAVSDGQPIDPFYLGYYKEGTLLALLSADALPAPAVGSPPKIQPGPGPLPPDRPKLVEPRPVPVPDSVAADKPAAEKPKGLPPRIVPVVKVDDKVIVTQETVAKPVQVTEKKIVEIDGKKVTVDVVTTKMVYEMVQKEMPLENAKAIKAGTGKAIEGKDLAAALKANPIAFISTDGQPVDAAYLAAMHPDAVVLTFTLPGVKPVPDPKEEQVSYADPKPAAPDDKPKGVPPRIVAVSDADDKTITMKEVNAKPVTVQEKRTVEIDGKKQEITVNVTKFVYEEKEIKRKIEDAKAIRAGTGKAIDAKDLAAAIKKNPIVFVAVDGQAVDASYLGAMHPDAIVLTFTLPGVKPVPDPK